MILSYITLSINNLYSRPGWNADLNQYSISRIMPYAFCVYFKLLKFYLIMLVLFCHFYVFLYAIAPTFNNWLVFGFIANFNPNLLTYRHRLDKHYDRVFFAQISFN